MKSKYLEQLCCKECDYFYTPVLYSNAPTVCPECGAPVELVAGRYIYGTEKYMFGFKERTTVIGYEKRPDKRIEAMLNEGKTPEYESVKKEVFEITGVLIITTSTVCLD